MRLVREWSGKAHVVTIGEDKVDPLERARVALAVSEVARAITGTRWSGPAFFGLKKRKVGGMKTVRCAIYTRKSSEEGLEQDFNSPRCPARGVCRLHPEPGQRRLGRAARRL